MGHLVNAKRFRLGWSSGWSDFWFSDIYNYSMFFFLCARQRIVLHAIFFAPSMITSDFMFSHFTITRHLKWTRIELYFYFVPLYDLIDKVQFKVRRIGWKWKKNYYYRYQRSCFPKICKSDHYKRWFNSKYIKKLYDQIKILKETRNTTFLNSIKSQYRNKKNKRLFFRSSIKYKKYREYNFHVNLKEFLENGFFYPEYITNAEFTRYQVRTRNYFFKNNFFRPFLNQFYFKPIVNSDIDDNKDLTWIKWKSFWSSDKFFDEKDLITILIIFILQRHNLIFEKLIFLIIFLVNILLII